MANKKEAIEIASHRRMPKAGNTFPQQKVWENILSAGRKPAGQRSGKRHSGSFSLRLPSCRRKDGPGAEPGYKRRRIPQRPVSSIAKRRKSARAICKKSALFGIGRKERIPWPSGVRITFPSLAGQTVISEQAVLLTRRPRSFLPSRFPSDIFRSCSAIQWRDRAGLSPASLLSPCGHLFSMSLLPSV